MKFIAHRGNDNHSYKENTKEALLECLSKNYISGVELDIRLTKDKKYIIIHNTSYLVLGIDRKFIDSTNLEEAMKDGYSSLEDFLALINNNKMIIIEIKKEIGDYKDDLKEILRICNKYKHLNLYFCSFNYKLVNKLKMKCKFPVGLLMSDLINKNKDIDNMDFLVLSKNAYNDIKVKKTKIVWTINKRNQLKSNYTYVITDNAYLLL